MRGSSNIAPSTRYYTIYVYTNRLLVLQHQDIHTDRRRVFTKGVRFQNPGFAKSAFPVAYVLDPNIYT